jgi:hypothetical protein
MEFKLNASLHKTCKASIWIVYLLFLIYLIDKKNDIEIISGVLLSAVLIQLTLISFIDNWFKLRRPNLLDWFRLAVFMVIILNYFKILIDNNFNDLKGFPSYSISKRFLMPSLIVILIGLIGLKIGEILFIIFLKNQYKSHEIIKYKIKNSFIFYLLSIIVGVIQILLMIKGEVGYGTFQENTTSDLSFLFQTLGILSVFILSIFSIFKYINKNNENHFKVFFVIFFIIQIIYGFLSGMKESIITPLIVVLIPFFFGGFKLPRKNIFILVISLLLIYPFNNNYRDVLNSQPTIDKTLALGIAFSKTTELDFSENLENGGDNFSGRLSLFPFLVYSVENEAKWTYYKNLDRYIYLPVAWIMPRFLIPNKPISEIGAKLNSEIYGIETNSLTATTFGWAYFEGGFIYVLILFFLFGLFITYFQHNLLLDNFFGILLYSAILIKLLKVEEDIYFLISGILQTVLIYFLFYKFLIKEMKED